MTANADVRSYTLFSQVLPTLLSALSFEGQMHKTGQGARRTIAYAWLPSRPHISGAPPRPITMRSALCSRAARATSRETSPTRTHVLETPGTRLAASSSFLRAAQEKRTRPSASAISNNQLLPEERGVEGCQVRPRDAPLMQQIGSTGDRFPSSKRLNTKSAGAQTSQPY